MSDAPQTAVPPKAAPEPAAPAEETSRAGEQVLEGLETLAKNANSALNGLSDAAGLTPKVEQHPYSMVAAALGVGYVVGGGLFTPTSTRLLRMAMKLVAIPPVRDRLLDVAEAALDGILAQSKNTPDRK